VTTSAWLWIVGCVVATAASIGLITWLAKQAQPDCVSEDWMASQIRERRDKHDV